METGKELVDALKNATEKEREKIQRRLATMMVDLVTANAYEKAGILMQRIYRIDRIDEGDTLTMSYDLGVNGNVIRMLLAGIRRKK
jgi:hypothetical protein